MALTVKVDHPDFPEGTEFGIQGLGLFKNGESREVTEEEELSFASLYQMGAKDKLEQSKAITVDGSPIITDLEDILGKEISSLPSKDPTAFNLDPLTGEVFEHANLNGAVTNPDTSPPEEEEPPTPTTTYITPPSGTTVEEGSEE